jgi:organic radical activating enzyme
METEESILYNLRHLSQLVFEVTDACNLNCRYCGLSSLYESYSERKGKNLPFHKAQLIIDYLFSLRERPGKTDYPLSIGFYGGEPLLNMELSHVLIILLCYFTIMLVSATCFAQSAYPEKKPLPVLDKTKSYPSKKLDFETDVTYVPLETSKDVLLGEHCRLRYVSNEKIVISDEIRGDVFIFDSNGKIHSSFNQKNGLGYTVITSIIYDEIEKEIFILDSIKRKIFIFSENGALLRSFKTPKNTHIIEIYNFDENILLAFDENMLGSNKSVKPYIYVAKDDGKENGYVNINIKKVNPVQVMENTGKNMSRGYTFVHGGIPDNCKFGNEFILANRSMDTVYLLKQDKTLIPLFTQIPSVYSEHPTAASVGMITDQFLKITVSSYDIKEGVKIMKAGGRWAPKFQHYILNRETGEFFRYPDKGKFSVYKVDTPKNQHYRLMQAINLIKANEKGLLEGELKEIASKLDIGDNPVLKIEKFK